jgi:hypothetical protein
MNIFLSAKFKQQNTDISGLYVENNIIDDNTSEEIYEIEDY